jgi:hypothetical protein
MLKTHPAAANQPQVPIPGTAEGDEWGCDGNSEQPAGKRRSQTQRRQPQQGGASPPSRSCKSVGGGGTGGAVGVLAGGRQESRCGSFMGAEPSASSVSAFGSSGPQRPQQNASPPVRAGSKAVKPAGAAASGSKSRSRAARDGPR